MSRQDKATSEKHTKTLRELVKRPENKICADCKRNDPRWASWNLGVFVCIRCSGIHRSMGTHISKVKSVDLDIWTPEQMTSIMKWGNRRANLYWEAHLKPGHQPPDHKIESFIRSKYESRRWALEGSPPEDPAVLEQGAAEQAQVAEVPPPASSPPPAASTPPPRATPAVGRPAHTLLSSVNASANRRPLSPPLQSRAQAQPLQAQPAPAPAAKPVDDLFSLDFHGPVNPAAAGANNTTGSGTPKNTKGDIMSLFSSAAPQPPAGNAFGVMGSTGGQTGPTSMMGTSGPGAWGVSSGWSAPVQAPSNDIWGGFTSASPPAAQQPSQFGAFGSVAQPNMMNTQNAWTTPAQPQMPNANVWATPAGANGSNAGSQDLFGSFGSAPSTTTTQKKDDAFGDLWGGFK